MPKNKTSFLSGEGKIRVDHKGMHFKGVRHGEPYEFSVGYNDLYTLTTEDESMRIIGTKDFYCC